MWWRAFGKLHRDAEFAPVGDQEHAVPHLRHAVEGGVDQAVLGGVAEIPQRLGDLAHDVVAAVVQHVRHVLDHDRQRLRGLHVVQIAQVEVAARIDLERLRVLGDLAQLGAADAGIGLAGRAADQHVEGVGDRAELQVLDQLVRLQLGHVAGLGVPGDHLGCQMAVEVARVRLGRQFVQLHRRVDLEAGALETERDPAAAGEQVKDAQRLSASHALDLARDRALLALAPCPPLHPSPTAATVRFASLSNLASAVSHSHTTRTRHPLSWSLVSFLWSLATLSANFFCQKSMRDFGE